MNDTTTEVQSELRRRLQETDASRRLHMMSGMFSTARALALAAARGAGSAEEPHVVLFQRLYRKDFDEGEAATICAHLRRIHAG